MRISKKHIVIFLIIAISLFLVCNKEEPSYTETGTASYYARSLHGKITASGEIYHHDSLTAAHLTLPMGTLLKVVSLENGNSVVVRVNDRGPYVPNRILDLSRAAFKELAPLREGLIEVRITLMD